MVYLNRDLSPGRFEALTGRVDILDVLPLMQAEVEGATGGFMIGRPLDGADNSLGSAPSTTSTPPDHVRRDAGRIAAASETVPVTLVRELP
ncbi:hypothetical protein [Actinoplanes sp. NPDC051411]|uniref:hypothetical protein n=1 Tax=Actinoplanes sp. NPDC051411 TaxID=3155522 RepID=UPI00343209BD